VAQQCHCTGISKVRRKASPSTIRFPFLLLIINHRYAPLPPFAAAALPHSSIRAECLCSRHTYN
jgi:hypothetical protein